MKAPKLCGIYAIYSAINGRSYIGHSIDIKKRWTRHLSTLRNGIHKNPYLQNSWNKHGEEEFEFIVLEECLVECLIEREQHHFDTTPDKYKLAPVAGSSLGTKHTPETRANMSAAAMGNTRRRGTTTSLDARANMSAGQTGRKTTDETRAKLSEALTGRTHSPAAREKIRQTLLGHGVSPETRIRISASNKAAWARKKAADASDVPDQSPSIDVP